MEVVEEALRNELGAVGAGVPIEHAAHQRIVGAVARQASRASEFSFIKFVARVMTSLLALHLSSVYDAPIQFLDAK